MYVDINMLEKKKVPLSVGLEKVGTSRHWLNEAMDVTWLYDVVVWNVPSQNYGKRIVVETSTGQQQQ
jgi:hypothetical protein